MATTNSTKAILLQQQSFMISSSAAWSDCISPLIYLVSNQWNANEKSSQLQCLYLYVTWSSTVL